MTAKQQVRKSTIASWVWWDFVSLCGCWRFKYLLRSLWFFWSPPPESNFIKIKKFARNPSCEKSPLTMSGNAGNTGHWKTRFGIALRNREWWKNTFLARMVLSCKGEWFFQAFERQWFFWSLGPLGPGHFRFKSASQSLKTRRGGEAREHRRGERSKTFERNGFLEAFLEASFPSKNLLKMRQTFLESKCFLTPSGSPPLTLCEIQRTPWKRSQS